MTEIEGTAAETGLTPKEGLLVIDAEFAERVAGVSPVKKYVVLLNPFFWGDGDPHGVISDIAREAGVSFSSGVEIDSVERLDYVLVMIANNPDISDADKLNFFRSLKARSDELLVDWVVEDGGDGIVDVRSHRPLSATYVLSPHDLGERERELVSIKDAISSRARAIIAQLPEGQRQLGRNVFNPSVGYTESVGVYSVAAVLRGDDVNIDAVGFARLEVLRWYREYVNVLLAQTRIDRHMAEDQQDGGFFYDSGRVGDVYGGEHAGVLSRYAYFLDMHMGASRALDIHPPGVRDRLVAVDPATESLLMGNQVISAAIDVEQLISDDEERVIFEEQLAALRGELDRKLGDNEIEIVVRGVLLRLGILTPDADRVQQAQAYLAGNPPDEYRSTYVPVVKKGGRGFSVNHRYSVFVIGAGRSRSVRGLLKIISHEVGHVFQRIARSGTELSAFQSLPTLGRSSILAESGAIRLEAIVTALLGEDPRLLNRYHYDMVVMLMQGGNFWDVYNVALSAVKQRDGTVAEGISPREARVALKAAMRVYNLGGATGDPQRREGRLPTSTSLLRYVYQGIPPYNQYPYYVSGIPSHRLELASLLSEPRVDDKPITEGTVIRAVVGALHEYLFASNSRD